MGIVVAVRGFRSHFSVNVRYVGHDELPDVCVDGLSALEGDCYEGGCERLFISGTVQLLFENIMHRITDTC